MLAMTDKPGRVIHDDNILATYFKEDHLKVFSQASSDLASRVNNNSRKMYFYEERNTSLRIAGDK